MATLKDYYNIGDDEFLTSTGNNWAWIQTFTPATSFTLYSVKVLIYHQQADGDPLGNCIVNIRATDVNGFPTGADLCTYTFDPLTLTANTVGEWKEIVFSPSTNLVAGTKYALSIELRNAVSTANYVAWRCDGSAPSYTGGNAVRNGDIDWDDTFSNQAYDFMFELYQLGVVFPTDSITRVTSIIHRYNRAEQVDTMEVSLGDVVSDFGLPEWAEGPRVAQLAESDTPATKGDIDKAIGKGIIDKLISPPPVTETGVPGITFPFVTKPVTATQLGVSQMEYDKMVQQTKTIKALQEFGPISSPADLDKFKKLHPELGIGKGIPRIGTPEYTKMMLGKGTKSTPTKKWWEFWK